MLAELDRPATNAVWKASLVRLLSGCADPAIGPAIGKRLDDPSPLVRSRAATVLGERLSRESVPFLLAATRDPSRLVRIRAAEALAALPLSQIPSAGDRSSLDAAVAEFQNAMKARPDDWASHANLGNFAMERGQFSEAVVEFETATRLEPRVVGPLVNAALAHSNLNQNDPAESCLRRALALEPENASAQFNLGLLLGEGGRFDEAEKALRAALKADPQMAAAAYNLGVIISRKNGAEAVQWCRKAHQLQPDDPKYAHALAFYQRQYGDRAGAVTTLRQWLDHHPQDVEGILLLGQIYEDQNDLDAARAAYRTALDKEGLPPAQRAAVAAQLRRLGDGR